MVKKKKNEKHGKILIVEDEKPMARALKLKLENNDFDVEAAEDGSEALDIIDDSFDLVLLDLVMPNTDGFEVLEALKSKDGEPKTKAKVIVLSNLSQESDIQKAKDMGAEDFFVKSDMGIKEIVDKVNDYI